MNPGGLPQEPQREGSAPAASLTLVRVQRRRSLPQASRKAGDLTQLMETRAPEPTPAPAPPAPMPIAAVPVVPASMAPPAAAEPALSETTEEDAAAVIALPPPSVPAEEDFELPAVAATFAPHAPIAEEQPEPELEPAFASIGVAPPAAPTTELVAELPPADEPATETEPLAAPHGADALIDYWDELAGDRLFPAFAELDRERINEYWPNTVLLTFGAGDMPRMTRLGEPDGEVEYNLMVTDWIMTRGRQAAERAEALEEEQRFPMGRERVRYRLVLLPCSNDGGRVDHMLCHLSRLAEQPKLSAVASFKRWLAS